MMTKSDEKLYTAETEVRITFRDGTQVVETWRGISKRHAVGRARDKYGDDDEVAKVDFASGEPW